MLTPLLCGRYTSKYSSNYDGDNPPPSAKMAITVFVKGVMLGNDKVHGPPCEIHGVIVFQIVVRVRGQRTFEESPETNSRCSKEETWCTGFLPETFPT